MGEINDSFWRYTQFGWIISNRRQAALNKPLNEDLIRQGYVDYGDDFETAKKKISERFNALLRSAQRYSILDMCAVFERLSLSFINAAVWESRKNVREHYSIPHFISVKESFIREAQSFGSFDSLIALLNQRNPELCVTLRKIRDLRNQIAHGEINLSNDGLSVDFIRDTLNRALAEFGVP